MVLAAQTLEGRALIRFLKAALAVVLPVATTWQRMTGKIPADVARNRLGHPTVAVPDKPVIWLHAASLGELNAIRPVLRYLVERHPDHAILATVNNHRALEVAAGWGDVPLIGQAAPIDVPRVLRRFLRNWKPVAFINVEAELWPNRFAALAAVGVPSIFLNARLSDKSLSMLQRLGPEGLHLDNFRHFFAQSAATTANLQALGIPTEKIETTPNLKALVDLPPAHELLAGLPRDKTILAASTHPPEEAAVLRAYLDLRKKVPELRLILSPRHARRAPEVAELVRRAGLRPAMLSPLMEVPGPNAVVVVDELGVQPALYGCAAVSFVGGSLPDGIGGHTPYEPLRAGSAIVTGPNVSNFAAEYATLSEAGACVEVADAEELAGGLSRSLEQAPALATAAQAALPTPVDPKLLFARISEKLGVA